MLLTEDLEIIQSPLNYTGGKYKLLPQLLPLFPRKIDIFVDLFCGGGNVGININSQRIILNDINDKITHLFNTFKNLGKNFISMVYDVIENYELSQSNHFGYNYYTCDSNTGLADYNKDKFLNLREDFNKIEEINYTYYVMLYVLIIYSFNNQIRFNSQGKFNLPVGKRDFNEKMQTKLRKFITRLENQDYEFLNFDFRVFDISGLTSNSLVYVDPPYLITCATYNEQGGWNNNDENDLLDFLDMLSKNGIKFALSNVLKSKGKKNQILIDWLNKNNKRYKIINLDFNYRNSNYQAKNKEMTTEEVLITNY